MRVSRLKAVEASQEQAALDWHLHPLDRQHGGPAGRPQLPLWTSEVLGENEEAETQDRAGEARGVGDGEVGGDHPPVHPPPVHQPGEGGTWVTGGGRAVDGQLVPRQVTQVGWLVATTGSGGQTRDDWMSLWQHHHCQGGGGRAKVE